MPDTSRNSAPAFSDAIWVIVLTATSYVVAFAYASGFAKYFNVPTDLISISPNLLLSAGKALLKPLILLYGLTYWIWPLLPRSETALTKAIRVFVIKLIAISFFLSPLLAQGEGWYIYIGAVFFNIFLDFILPIFAHRKIATFEQKLAEQDKIERNTRPFSLDGAAVNRFGKAPVLFVLLLFAISSFTHSQGAHDAKAKTDFLLIKGAPNTVLLAQYDSIFVTQTFDPKSKTLTGEIKVIKLGDGKEIQFTTGSVGPLAPHEVKK